MAEINKSDVFAPDLNEPLKELQGTLEDVLSTLGHLRQSGKSMESTFKSTAEVTKKTNEETKKLSEGIKDLEIAENKLNESKKKNAKVQEKELNALQQLKKELKEAQSAMLKAGDAGGTMSKEYQTAAKKAGELADKIGDAKDEAKVFANDTAFGALGTRIGLLKDKVLSLDFKGVGEQLKGVAKIIMANPLLLLAGVIAGIVVALYKFRDSIPFVGAALDKIGQGVDYVVGKLKEFSDWLGISEFAAKDKADAVIKYANEEMKAVKKSYDQQVAIAAAAGEDTVEMEKQKWEEIAKLSAKGLKTSFDPKKSLKDQSAEYKGFIDSLAEANVELQIINNKAIQKDLKARAKAKEEEMKLEKVVQDYIKKFMLTLPSEKQKQYEKELELRKQFLEKFKSLGADEVKTAMSIDEAILQGKEAINKRISDGKITAAQRDKDNDLKNLQETQAIYEQFASSIGSLFAAISEGKLQDLEIEKKANKENLDKGLLSAGDNEAAKEAIKRKAAKVDEQILAKQLEIRQRQARYDKATALFNAGLNTAVAITKAIPNPVLIALSAALGALQITAIAAKPIPKFFTGVGSSPEGLAFVGERGSELMNVPGQGLMLSPNTATLTNLKRGTEIVPHEKSMAMLAGAGVNIGKGKDFQMLSHLQLVNNSVKMIGGQIVEAVQGSTGRLMEQGSQVFTIQKRLDGSRRMIRLKSLSA